MSSVLVFFKESGHSQYGQKTCSPSFSSPFIGTSASHIGHVRYPAYDILSGISILHS
jgi:hypothetical protein